MNTRRPAIRIMTLLTLVLVTVSLATQLSEAQERARSSAPPPIVVSQLQGTWTATLSGVNGCGTATLLITFTLDAKGNGVQTSAVNHTAGCGDSTTTGLPVQVQSLNSHGNGFIAIGCGAGCGYGFNLQVTPNRQMFNLGAQSVAGNYLAGVAVRVQ